MRSRGSRAAGRLAAAIACAAALSASCGPPEAFTVARANRLFRDGYAHEAAALYLKAGAGTEPIASYDLANVFADLGEGAAASAMYETAIASGGASVAARSHYNEGARAYADADYPAAAAAFRKALEAYIGSGGAPARLGAAEAAVRREMSRAYELALKAQAERRDAAATERSRYEVGKPGGSVQPFALSRTDEKTLFAPGGYEAGAAEDH